LFALDEPRLNSIGAPSVNIQKADAIGQRGQQRGS